MKYILIIVFVLIIVCALIYNIIINNKIRKNGIEAEAEISRIDIDRTQTVDSDGMVSTDITKYYYVTYTNTEGEVVEARLSNPKFNSKEGDIIKIKYLPEKPNRVIRIK